MRLRQTIPLSEGTGSEHEHADIALKQMRVFSTTATVAISPSGDVERAVAILGERFQAIERACSRFRSDSEIWSLYEADGQAVRVSTLLFELIAVACEVAERTGGAVDPTVGSAVEGLGYDRDFSEVRTSQRPLDYEPRPAPGWWNVSLDASCSSVRLPPGTRLDLGASAKAFAVDQGVRAVASAMDCGALVGVGGDIAVAGPSPEGGWPISISTDSSAPLDASGPVVSLSSGGLASSSTVVRSWGRAGRRLHHIVDPLTGDIASEYWRLVSVASDSCVDANAASTASIVLGDRALTFLDSLALPARLVRHDGVVIAAGGWPSDLLDDPPP